MAVFYPNGDPLSDGQGCGPTGSMYNYVSSPTTDDIEVRSCCSEEIGGKDSPIQLV